MPDEHTAAWLLDRISIAIETHDDPVAAAHDVTEWVVNWLVHTTEGTGANIWDAIHALQNAVRPVDD